MMNIEDPRIQQYIDNELNDSEKLSFEKELESNPEIQEYIAFKKFIIEGIRSEGDEELKEYIRSRVQDESTENQTNLWLYAVASVTLVLVSYFFIVQYFKTGSLKEASKVLVLNEPTNNKTEQKTPFKYNEPNSQIFDSTLYSTDSFLALNDNPDESIDPENTAMEMSSAPEIQESKNFKKQEEIALDKEDLFIHQTTLIPIAIAMNDDSKMMRVDRATNADVESTVSGNRVALSKKKETAKLKAPVSNTRIAADTVRESEDDFENTKSRSKVKKAIEKISLVFVQHANSQPSIEIRHINDQIYLKITNLDNDNPLVYSINEKFYLELGPKSIYFIPNSTTILNNPKPITDKSIIKAIQN